LLQSKTRCLMSSTGDPADVFRRAENRLRGLLFGNGVYEAGVIRGEERRAQVARELRRMQQAFYAAVAAGEESRASGEARIADLEEELEKIASASPKRRARSRGKPDANRPGSTG